MKKLNKYLLFIILTTIIWSQSFAGEVKNDSLKFSGVIKRYTKGTYTHLYISWNREDALRLGKIISFTIEIDSNGTFSFKLPDLGRPSQLYLTSNKYNGVRLLYSRPYITEPGDDVYIIINTTHQGSEVRGLIHFYGPGSGKYNLVEELERQFWYDYYGEIGNLVLNTSAMKDIKEYNIQSKKLANLLRKYKEKKALLINHAKIDVKIKTMINFEYGTYHSEWMFRTISFYKKNILHYKDIAAIYSSYGKEFFEEPDSLSIYCSSYLKYLREKIILDLCIDRASGLTTIESYYNYIKVNYSGILRDELINEGLLKTGAQMNFEFINPSLKDSLLKDALPLVNSLTIKEIISKQILTNSKINNKKIIDAQFTLINGNSFDLKSLKGKVFLLDTWFNGCFGCAGFHTVFMEDIYPKFKDNKDFVVLSVNTDKNKERWTSGITSKLYTSEDHINVTTGTGFEHSFFKYYGVIGAPYLMLVDDDGIIRYQPKGSSVEVWIEQIKAALEKKAKANYR